MNTTHTQGDPEPVDDHDRGLAFDLPRLVTRRTAVGVLASGVGSVLLAACGGSDGASTTTGASATATAAPGSSGASTTSEIPEETAGPFPGDGSNGPDVLAQSGVVREDITKSFGDASGVAEGVATTIEMTLLDVAAGGTPLAGAAVYAWHCDRAGRYSLYDQEIAGENYLRGVQESDGDGRLSFKTIFPAAYMGRWPHVHFEVYESLDAATAGEGRLRTSQLAIPEEICNAVYATDGYEQSVQNLSRTSLESDIVFSDGYRSQLATAGGSVEDGITLTLNVGV
jgi:protocatechuate 3,4-dioxygenase beta subunit